MRENTEDCRCLPGLLTTLTEISRNCLRLPEIAGIDGLVELSRGIRLKQDKGFYAVYRLL